MKQSYEKLIATTHPYICGYHIRNGKAFSSSLTYYQQLFVNLLNTPLFNVIDWTKSPDQSSYTVYLKSYEMARTGEVNQELLSDILVHEDWEDFKKSYGIYN